MREAVGRPALAFISLNTEQTLLPAQIKGIKTRTSEARPPLATCDCTAEIRPASNDTTTQAIDNAGVAAHPYHDSGSAGVAELAA